MQTVKFNPALGVAIDLLVRPGGTGILSETPEIYYAKYLLTRRAVPKDVAEILMQRLLRWDEYTRKTGDELNNYPSSGNKAGGLTTILERSLGTQAKDGTTNLTAVYKYAEPITNKGFVFMDSPGYDPVSVMNLRPGKSARLIKGGITAGVFCCRCRTEKLRIF